MVSTPYFVRNINLSGQDIVFDISVVIIDPVTPPKESGIETRELIARVDIVIKHQGNSYKFAHRFSAWDNPAYDLLDLSMCLAHFAQRDDTTEELSDILKGTNYLHSAQWIMSQEFFEIELLLYSKNTKRFKGKRWLSFLIYRGEKFPGVADTITFNTTRKS